MFFAQNEKIAIEMNLHEMKVIRGMESIPYHYPIIDDCDNC